MGCPRPPSPSQLCRPTGRRKQSASTLLVQSRSKSKRALVRESIGEKNDFYTHDYTASLTGRQYSFDLPSTIGTNGNDEQLFLFLLPDPVYTIFLHDPDYFIYNTNPVALIICCRTRLSLFNIQRTGKFCIVLGGPAHPDEEVRHAHHCGSLFFCSSSR